MELVQFLWGLATEICLKHLQLRFGIWQTPSPSQPGYLHMTQQQINKSKWYLFGRNHNKLGLQIKREQLGQRLQSSKYTQ